MSRLFIGLMAGTSGDGIDAVVADLAQPVPRVLGWRYSPYATDIRERILSMAAGVDDNLDELATLDQELGKLFAGAAMDLLASSGLDPAQIEAIGSHGQTVRHRSRHQSPYTVQIADPNQIAEITGITTVADFRRRDMAAGGEGAPLASGFHRHVFSATEPRAILNLGGIANLTLLAPGTEALGFDTGPASALMDGWYARHHNDARFDAGGEWASGGQVDAGLLARLLGHAYFGQLPPKSCGREEFNLGWLDETLTGFRAIDPRDVQATLAELTALSVADALRRNQPDCARLIVCGGGVHNDHLMRRLDTVLGDTPMDTSAAFGVDPDQLEAIAFAWLASRALDRLPGNLPGVTGASGERILGAIFPGAWLRP